MGGIGFGHGQRAVVFLVRDARRDGVNLLGGCLDQIGNEVRHAALARDHVHHTAHVGLKDADTGEGVFDLGLHRLQSGE